MDEEIIESLFYLSITLIFLSLGFFLSFEVVPAQKLACEEYSRACGCLVSCNNYGVVLAVVFFAISFISLALYFSKLWHYFKNH